MINIDEVYYNKAIINLSNKRCPKCDTKFKVIRKYIFFTDKYVCHKCGYICQF